MFLAPTDRHVDLLPDVPIDGRTSARGGVTPAALPTETLDNDWRGD